MEKEFWRDVVGYEGLYQVSNWGRVKSLNYNHTGKEKILKLGKNNFGYLRVSLCKNGKEKNHKVHRLVAEAWLPNPDNLPCVNHKDEDKANNRVENLEWCDRAYNCNYGSRGERISKALTNGKKSKPVVGISPNTGEVIVDFPSTNEAGRNGFSQSAISRCCRNKGYKTHHGLIWCFKEVS